jgi:hypothetical protein
VLLIGSNTLALTSNISTALIIFLWSSPVPGHPHNPRDGDEHTQRMHVGHGVQLRARQLIGGDLQVECRHRGSAVRQHERRRDAFRQLLRHGLRD